MAEAPTVVTVAERPELADRGDEATADVWPEYNRHGDLLAPGWGRMRRAFPDFELVLLDSRADEVLAQVHSLPVVWDGTVAGLPRGIDGVFEHAFDAGAPTTLCAMAVEIVPRRQGRGLARSALEALAALARDHGLRDVLAPVRPSWKERYPLVPIQRYASWARPDGLPFDPWLRVHARLGGEQLQTDPRSLRISGTVGEWEEWTAMAFPETGEYWFPHGLATVAIDRRSDSGRYWEPNVWLRHRVA
jgi:GNAT superfamily N-acetyltransferase